MTDVPLTIEAWHEQGFSPKKGELMDMTQENFYRIIAMHDELVHEQKDEISKLKAKVNQLQLKKDSATDMYRSLHRQIMNLRSVCVHLSGSHKASIEHEISLIVNELSRARGE